MSWESIFSAGLSDDDAQAWGRMVDELRAVHDAVASMRFDREAVDALAADLGVWRERLAPLAGEELAQVNGRVPQLPVRAHAMLPQMSVRSVGGTGEGNGVEGTARFGRWFMGGGMAVHGGAITLLFDELLGILAASQGEGITRTAYLHTDYRALTPIDTDLVVTAEVYRTEGRKLFVRGEIRRGDVVCAEADSLFLRLSPEQGLGRRAD